MSALWLVIALVVVQRLAELAYAARNSRRLLAQGGLDAGRDHYPLFILLHGSWLIAIVAAAPEDPAIRWFPLSIFLLMQILRVWVLATLGRFWTTRIITLPGAPLIRSGPYRYLRHPNYLIVIGEIASLPLVFGEWAVALGFSILNLMLLALRIKVEDSALAARRQSSIPSSR